jgi:hypothetical protein
MKWSLLAAIVMASACTTDMAPAGGGDDMPMVDAGVTAMPDAPGPMVNPAVARGEEWVAAKVPYCQAINHAHDYDAACPMTCTRPDNPLWDPYRSDCSGFVSWAWGLPSTNGGRNTAGFAPFKLDISHAISGVDLQPGDALNNSTHEMLFKEWVTPMTKATFMEEPGCSSATPYAHEFTATVQLMGNLVVVLSHGTFTAIRQN